MVTIRKAQVSDANLISHIQRVSWFDTYNGIIEADYLNYFLHTDNSQSWIRFLKNSNGNAIILQYENKDVGFAVWGKQRGNWGDYKQELYAIYILLEYRKLKIGETAVRYIRGEVKNEKVFVWVLDRSPALSFYAKMGVKLPFTRTIVLEGNNYIEISYEV
jgi:predicted acetyltransferase